MVKESVVFVAFASLTRSLTFWSLLFVMNAPRITGAVCTPAQGCLQHVRAVLKPATSCSWPTTRTSFALRAAVVLGTSAHARAKEAAARCAAATELDRPGVPVAVELGRQQHSTRGARTQ